MSAYTDLITSQHRQSNFLSIVDGITSPFVDLQNIVFDFNIQTAVGWFLDVIGQWVGLNRAIVLNGTGTVLTDDQYRIFLKMQIAANSWNGTKESAYSILSNLFTAGDIKIFDNQDMTMTMCLQNTALTSFLIALIMENLIPLRPFGVYMKICTGLNEPLYFGIGLISLEVTTLQ